MQRQQRNARQPRQLLQSAVRTLQLKHLPWYRGAPPCPRASISGASSFVARSCFGSSASHRLRLRVRRFFLDGPTSQNGDDCGGALVDFEAAGAGTKRDFETMANDSVGEAAAKLHPLARRVPKTVKKAASGEETRQRLTARKCAIKVVDWVMRNEAMAPDIWTYITTDFVKLHGDSEQQGCFDKPPESLKAVPKAWKGQFLQLHSEGALSNAVLQKLDDQDENAISDLFGMFTKTSGSEQLPEEFVDKGLLAIAMKARLDMVAQCSIKEWVDKHISGDSSGRIQWLRVGPYEYTFGQDGRLSQVKHWGGIVVNVPAEMVVDHEFLLTNASNEVIAEFSKGLVQHNVAKLFQKTAGPHLYLFDRRGKAMSALLKTAQGIMSERKAAISGGSDQGLKLRDHAKERRNTALAEARQKLKAAPQRRNSLKVSAQVMT